MSAPSSLRELFNGPQKRSRRIDMGGLTLKRIQSSYTIEIAQADYDILVAAEDAKAPGTPMRPSLLARLELEPGIENVEYDGHFGPSIYLSITAEQDSQTMHGVIATLINHQIERAKEWKRLPPA